MAERAGEGYAVNDSPRSGARNFGLDLARALAILGVLLAQVALLTARQYSGHPDLVFFALYSGNGVELFFALSGFLIGGLLIEVTERGSDAVELCICALLAELCFRFVEEPFMRLRPAQFRSAVPEVGRSVTGIR